MIRSLAILFFTLSSFAVMSQSIEVMGKLRGDSVILRWAPTTPIAWKLGNNHGYNVFRYEIGYKDDSLSIKKEIVAQRLKPLPLDDWEPLVKRDKYAAIAAQALYGESFEVSGPGNDPMSFFNNVKELENRFGYSLYAADISPLVAKAMGIYLVDIIPDKTKKWAFKVELAENPTTTVVSPGSAVIDPNEKITLSSPTEFKAEFRDHLVRLSWETIYDFQIYNSYIIERSEDGGKSYITRSQSPMAVFSNQYNDRGRMYFIDSLEYNYKAYHFRVRGITPFGEIGPPSNAVYGAGVGSAKGVMASIDSSAVTADGKGFIEWNFPSDKINKLSGFKVARSNKAKGPFKDISALLNVDQHEFKDPYPDPVNYYIVKAIGRDNLAVESMPVLVQLLDSIPPLSPKGLTGSIDTLGNVSLDWLANGESDLAGYRVFRANSLQEEFIQVTAESLKFSQFYDSISLNNLTEEIYYKIVALDKHDNPSDYSQQVKLKKPDKIPPVSPAFKSWQSDEEGIKIEWIKSSSGDVTQHIFSRKDDYGDTILIEIKEGENKYLDKNVVAGESYTYILQALDDDDLLSAPANITIQAFDDGIQPAIQSFKGKANRDARYITLTWKYTAKDIKRYLIYRKKGEEPMRLMTSIGGNAQAFIDNNISVNNIYSYRIKAVFENDDESEMTDEISIEY